MTHAESSVSLSSIDELISPLVSRGSVSNIHRECFGVWARKEHSERGLSFIAVLVVQRRKGSLGVHGCVRAVDGGCCIHCHGLCCYP